MLRIMICDADWDASEKVRALLTALGSRILLLSVASEQELEAALREERVHIVFINEQQMRAPMCQALLGARYPKLIWKPYASLCPPEPLLAVLRELLLQHALCVSYRVADAATAQTEYLWDGDILLLQAIGTATCFYLPDHIVVTEQPLEKWIKAPLLCQSCFQRVDRCFLVAVDAVERCTPGGLILRHVEKRVRVSALYRQTLLRKLEQAGNPAQNESCQSPPDMV